MYPINNLTVTDMPSAQAAAQTLYGTAGEKTDNPFDKNGCLLLAAMLLHLSKTGKLDTVHLLHLYKAGLGPFLTRVMDDMEISASLAEIQKMSQEPISNAIDNIWYTVKSVVIFLFTFKPITFEEYRKRKRDLIYEIALRKRSLSSLKEFYLKNCPESLWIGRRVRTYALTETPRVLRPAGTGYLKDIHILEPDDLVWYSILLENEDGTPSNDTYTGPLIVKVELLEND